jgi:hypothetical protein
VAAAFAAGFEAGLETEAGAVRLARETAVLTRGCGPFAVAVGT